MNVYFYTSNPDKLLQARHVRSTWLLLRAASRPREPYDEDYSPLDGADAFTRAIQQVNAEFGSRKSIFFVKFEEALSHIQG